MLHIVDYDEDIDADVNGELFTECVEWTVDQLHNNPRVRRMAYDMWFFVYKRDAEKFKTFWLLKWAHNDLS